MPKRRVRRPAKPIEDHTTGMKGHIKRFFLSFTPKHFASYWLGRAGLRRLGKLAGVGVLFIFLVFLWYAKDLPTPGKINARVTAQTTKFYDSTEKHLLYELYGDQNRSIVSFDQIPAVAKNATIAIEDKNFYDHGSFSFLGILRAAIVDVVSRNKSQGGSTITQQYVKNALLDPTDRSFSRKIKELILSMEIGQFYSKNDILALYLNEIPYGNRAYGVESACKTFFPMDIDKTDKDQHCAKNLNLGQSALLAAMLNAPSYYSPYGTHQPELIERQHLVLDLMVAQGYAKKADADAARWTVDDLAITSDKISHSQNQYGSLDTRMAHFVLYTQDYLESKYGTSTVTEGGLKVITTMDYDKQVAAYDAIQKNMNNVRALGGSNAALVSTDPKTGHLLAMIGSHDFTDPNGGQVNVATSQRQPGSSFKPIVYATLFGKNENAACAKDRSCPTYGPGMTIYDVPTSFGGNPEYKPNNFGDKNYGIITARQALAGSLNVPAVKALAMAGIGNSIQTAQSLGIDTLKSPDTYGLSLVLGTGGVELTEMANAYESFANGGEHFDQTPVLKLYDQKGKVMEDNTKPPKPKQALDPQVASLMADVLSDTNAKKYVFGNDLVINNICGNNSATNCVHAGVKTGTTEHYNDAWTVGFTPDITAGVWVGNNDNSPMNSAAADIAAPIWRTFMNAVVGGKPTAAFVKAPGIKTVTLDKQTGRAVTAGTKNSTVDIFPSWYVPMTSVGGKTAQIDLVSGLLATECTPDLAKQTIYSSAIQPEITRAENATQYTLWLAALQHAGYSTSGGDVPTASDDKHHCDDQKPTVNILGANGGGPYNFNVQVASGTFLANKLQVYFDDQIVSTQVIDGDGTYPISYTPTQTGSHTFKAVVTDAGYYQASDEQTVDVTNTGASGGGVTLLSPSDSSNHAGGNIIFSWAPDGSSSYTLHVSNATYTTTSPTKTVPISIPGNYSWYVTDDNGTSDTRSLTIH